MPTNLDITATLPRSLTVLEASAGTGKTWAIAALATRLIAEGHATVDQLLIITFTRAAAAELRSRIRSRFTQVAHDLTNSLEGSQGGAHGDGVTSFYLNHPPKQKDVMISRLRRASQNIDSATITTIHGFCFQALTELGVLTGMEPVAESAFDILQEVTADIYIHQYLDCEKPPFDYRSAQEIATTVCAHPSAALHPPHPDDEATKARVDFAHRVREEFTIRKNHNHVLTYDDLLTKLVDVVDPPTPTATSEAARARLRRRWGHALVDEFQDTDDLQWRILSTVFTEHADLTLIGDPKQAIYAFRGGDIATYLQATQAADSRYTLGFNYRSDKPLVHTLNRLFRGIALGHRDITAPQVESGKSTNSVDLPPNHPRLRVRVIDPEGFTRNKTKNIPIQDLRRAISNDVVEDIAELLNSTTRVRDSHTGHWRKVNAGDVAVLCHAHRDVQTIRDALLKAGIPAVSRGGVSVFDTDAATHWLTLVHALEHPHTPTAVAASAISPFFGFTETQLVTNRDEVIDEVATTLRHLHSTLKTHGPMGVYEYLQGWGEQGLSARVMASGGGRRLLTDLAHIAQLAHAALPQTTPPALLQWLVEKLHNPPTDSSQRVESSEQGVQVFTIHGAKGLQFPFVYLPTLTTQSPPRNPTLVFHHQGQRWVDVSSTAPKHVSDIVREENRGEAMRLVYVAMTRAVGQVVAYWAPAQHVSRSPFTQVLAHHGADIGPRTPHTEVVAHLKEALGQEGGVETITSSPITPPALTHSAQSLRPARTWQGEVDRSWRRTSYTAVATDHPEDNDPLAILKETDAEHRTIDVNSAHDDPTTPHLPSPMADLPRGARFGSLVHAVLETINIEAPDVRREITTRLDQTRHDWGVKVDEKTFVEAIEAVVTTPLLPATHASLIHLDPTRMLTELDFDIPLDGGLRATGPPRIQVGDMAGILRQHLPDHDPLLGYATTLERSGYSTTRLRGYLTGSIDLVFEHEGKFYVADYKTNWLGSPDQPNTTATYTPDYLRRAMEGSTYPLQALFYTVALHRFLRWRLPTYDAATDLGGVLYLYVRGMAGMRSPVVQGASSGVFYWQPPPGLVSDLSALLDGERR